MLNVFRLKTLVIEKQHHYPEWKKNNPGSLTSKGDRSRRRENRTDKITKKENKPTWKR